MTNTKERTARLRDYLLRHEARGLAVAFSGGVDSSVLLHAAHGVLADRCVALVADSPSLPRAELRLARDFARELGVELVELRTDELALAGYRANAGDRCFWCRHQLFESMGRWARGRGFGALAYGEIVDDRFDHRPGRRAAEAFSVLSPLAEVGFSKADVREYARAHGLEVADKPAGACLASRLPVGTEVTTERLRRVERAEESLAPMGFRQLRVRDHHPRARVEVDPLDLPRARALGDVLGETLGALGFEQVEIAPYRRAGEAPSRNESHPGELSAGR